VLSTTKVPKINVLKGVKVKYPDYMLPLRSKMRRYWDAFLAVVIVYTAIQYPLLISFVEDDTVGHVRIAKYIDYAALVLFWVDIMINFRTTYYNRRDEEIIDGFLVARRYFKEKIFIVDL